MSTTNELMEYTTLGDIFRNIKLSIANPLHAVELSNSQFVVCYQDIVEKITEHGDVVKSHNFQTVQPMAGIYGNSTAFAGPRCLTIDAQDNILITECWTNPSVITLLSSELNPLGDINLNQHQITTPTRVHFDQETGRLYIIGEMTTSSNYNYNPRAVQGVRGLLENIVQPDVWNLYAIESATKQQSSKD